MQLNASIELTDREINFVQALAHGSRPTRAAKEAGYSVGSARNLLGRAHIRAALKAVSTNAETILREWEKRPC